jgi:predicted nuclease of restriction endonuclease-like (RecB) superfamily
MLTKGVRPLPEDEVTPEEEIKDPLILEFLGLKDEYSESDLEEALIDRLEHFLLELGGDSALVARRRRLRIGDARTRTQARCICIWTTRANTGRARMRIRRLD